MCINLDWQVAWLPDGGAQEEEGKRASQKGCLGSSAGRGGQGEGSAGGECVERGGNWVFRPSFGLFLM